MAYGKPTKTPKDKTYGKPTRRSSEPKSTPKSQTAEDRIRADLKSYRKRVLQAPGRAVGMGD